jgi:quercetin dioxygenase-like cupin family protein
MNAMPARAGLRVTDWNHGRKTQGNPGHEIATLFSVVIGDGDSADPARFVHVRMKPGSVPRLWHSHPSWTTTIVLEGSLDIEGQTFTAGQMVVVAPNVGYGPLKPGPDGAAFIEIFSDTAATRTDWDESDPRVAEYRGHGWITT